ncbi:GNAT family N-acetyltransferase [Phenylobacterium sp. J367]|uniref:GNAT family N-acetyltransferase n=1 Tax=Phenylobacterium sp. J367 TaxID=2898435 RepID=UPI002151759B|nr:N-acetyltransferase [Phenylobacterium sp. J367]MCR5877377.1 N-acetyltransferase [Phenylobacterium sp. J367]
MSVDFCPPPPSLTLKNEQLAWSDRIEGLLDRAFGPGRFVKVSERVREIAEFAPELSFCAFDGETLVGVVRMWRVKAGGETVVFLGPLAVDPDQQSAGVGGLLVEKACAAAKAAGEAWVVLVGDAPYFQRFGFTAADAAAIRLPGPVDQTRVQALKLRADAAPLAGPMSRA